MVWPLRASEWAVGALPGSSVVSDRGETQGSPQRLRRPLNSPGEELEADTRLRAVPSSEL